MKNGDKPAYPSISTNWSLAELNNGMQDGLTKREYFAAMAMQGILSSSADRGIAYVAQSSIQFADELLKQLES